MLRLRIPRLFPSVPAPFATKGSVILQDDRYLEIEKNESQPVARQAGFIKLETIEILTGKKEYMQLSANGKIHKVDTEKVATQVQYVDRAAGVLVVADAEFNPIEVPLAYVSSYAGFLEAGDACTLVKDSETGSLVKCIFALPVLQRVAKAGKK